MKTLLYSVLALVVLGLVARRCPAPPPDKYYYACGGIATDQQGVPAPAGWFIVINWTIYGSGGGHFSYTQTDVIQAQGGFYVDTNVGSSAYIAASAEVADLIDNVGNHYGPPQIGGTGSCTAAPLKNQLPFRGDAQFIDFGTIVWNVILG